MDAQELRTTVAAAQAGDASAFKVLLQAYGPRLYGYFFRATSSHHDAEDLLGEMMLRLVKQLPNYDDRGRFEPWLFRIAANMIRDRIRRNKTAPGAISLSAEDEDGGSMVDTLPADSPAATASLLSAEASVELNSALERLDPTTRQMILLRHFGDMSFKEIAELFACPIGTVLAKVHRGLKALRNLMSD